MNSGKVFTLIRYIILTHPFPFQGSGGQTEGIWTRSLAQMVQVLHITFQHQALPVIDQVTQLSLPVVIAERYSLASLILKFIVEPIQEFVHMCVLSVKEDLLSSVTWKDT